MLEWIPHTQISLKFLFISRNRPTKENVNIFRESRYLQAPSWISGSRMCLGPMLKTSVKNGMPMPELVKIDLLFVKVAPRKKISCLSATDGGHFGKRCFLGLSPRGHRSSFLRSQSELNLKTTKKLRFYENRHGIQKNDNKCLYFILMFVFKCSMFRNYCTMSGSWC